MNQNQRVVKISLMVNIGLVSFQYLAILWFLGPFCQQFQSIFESMNTDLPTLTSLIMAISSLITGFLGWLAAILILVLGSGAAYAVNRINQIYIVLPIVSALQSFALLAIFVIFTFTVLPMLTLLSGVS